MKRTVVIRLLGIVGVLALLLANNYRPVSIQADGGIDTQVSKVSSSLSLHIKLKSQALAFPDSGWSDQTALPGLNPNNSDPTFLNHEEVFLYFNQPPTASQLSDLQSQGVTAYPDSWIPPVANHPNGFILADMPVDKLDALSSKDYVVQIDTAERESQPQNDLARAAMGVASVWSDGDTGVGVTVAVLDSGIDTSNPDFPALNASNSKDYSNYPALDDTIANTVNGHGTHVTGSLLGRGVNSPTYKGVAPGANLVFLKIGNDTTSAASSSALIYALKAAVDTYHAKIINVSYGIWSEYHDGSDAVSQAADYATSRGAAVFAAAGNDADKDWHCSGIITDTSDFIQVNLTGGSGNNTGLGFNLVWFSGLGQPDGLSLKYYDSSKTELTDISIGSKSESPRGVESISSGYNKYVGAGTYYLKVQNASNSNETFHIYYDSSENKTGYATVRIGSDPNYTIESPAEADSVIAVGAYVTRSNWTNYQGLPYSFNPPQHATQIASYSSRGPRVNFPHLYVANYDYVEDIIKPNIMAPGDAIISARDPLYTPGDSRYDGGIIDNDGQNLNGSGPANYIVLGGTSMACPMAAGVGALLLSKNPNLNPAQLRHALEVTATDNWSGYESSVGWGLINAQAAINASVTMNSYDDLTHQIATTNFSDGSTQHTVYLHGTDFLANPHVYNITYYDGSNKKVETDHVTSSGDHTLSNQHTFVPGIDVAGTWHAVVSEPQFQLEDNYNSLSPYAIASISFNVQSAAISTPPTVITNPASNINNEYHSAVLNGSLTAMGTAGSVTISFDWGTDATYTMGNILAWPSTYFRTGTFTIAVGGLIEGQTYHYRAKAVGDGTGYGKDMTFVAQEPGPLSKIIFSAVPGECKAGTAFYIQPIIQLQDTFGNIVIDSNAPVTLNITGGTGKNGAVLTGITTVNAMNGVATFGGLSINLANPAGNLYTLTATSGNLTATSGLFKVIHPGDANGDGQLTMNDVTLVEREILLLNPWTCGADADNDGGVTMGDVTKIERIILGLDPLKG